MINEKKSQTIYCL